MGVDASVLNPTTLEAEKVQDFHADSQKTSVGVAAGGFFSPRFAAGVAWSRSDNVNLDVVARHAAVQAANYLAQSLANAGPAPAMSVAPASGQPSAAPAQALMTSTTQQTGELSAVHRPGVRGRQHDQSKYGSMRRFRFA